MILPGKPPERFTIHFEDVAIADLKERLARTRWPHALDGAGWRQGSDLGFVQRLVERWKGYDWRPHEKRLNTFNHFRSTIDGLGIHFIHERGRGPNVVPILLGHACFSSFYEFHHVIEALADPVSHGGDERDAFDVVAWSLPGFAFSDKPNRPGMGAGRMADIAHTLMTDVLGYERYGSIGGSWGGNVAWRLGMDFAESCLGLFLTQCPVSTAERRPGEPPLTAREVEFARACEAFEDEERGYFWLLTTRPESLAFALADSPAGLAGWVSEKLRVWSDCHGELGSTIPLDEILTSLSITWFTESIASSQRLYYESAHGDWYFCPDDKFNVRMGAMSVPGGLPYEAAPEETLRRCLGRLDYFCHSPRGGHWPAWEVPETFIRAVREFYRPIRIAS